MESCTKTNWSIKKTISNPKAKINHFKRIYKCHFNTRGGRKFTGDNKKIRAHSSKNINCPSQIIITIKKEPPKNTRVKNIDKLTKEWPCIIELKNNHNHSTDSAAALIKRRIGPQTKQEILSYFERGHSVASAYYSFNLDKMEEFGNNFDAMSADRCYFPTKNDFKYLWNVSFKNKFGVKTGDEMFTYLETILTSSKVSFKIERFEEHYAISLCTPLMQRVISLLSQTSEILFVDSTGNCDVDNHKIYFLATQSPLGGLPVGCIISTSEKTEVFRVALKNLMEIMSFKINPTLIITDDDLKERTVLQEIFPNSKLLLCTFHVLKAVWKWLMSANNGISKDDRQGLYKSFRLILMAENQEILLNNIETLLTNSKKYPKFTKYIQNLLRRKESWCLFYRKTLITRGSNTNNYVEVMFRLFKDIPLQRTKAYSVTQLTDFIITSFCSYYRQRILDVIMEKIDKTKLRKLLPDCKDVDKNSIICVPGALQYYVKSTSQSDTSYFVDMNIGVCSCFVGSSGKICKHQAAVIETFNIENACNTLTVNIKELLYKIATGTNAPTIFFYLYYE